MYRIYFIFRVVIVLKLIGSIVRFFKSFLPVFSKHFVICVTAIALVVTAASGVNSVKDCYLPLLFAAAFSIVLSFGDYYFFGSDNARYINNALGEFDKNLIYNCFDGKYTDILKEAVIDMHLLDFNMALEKYNALSEKKLSDNQRAVLSFYTGRCYQLMGYPANGVKYYEKALELGLKLNDTYLLAARCLVQNGRFSDALEYYNILLERNSYYDFILTDMGIAYLKMGDSEKALELFERSVDEGKNYSFALGGCSLAYLQMKNLEKSSEYYSEALRCNMEDVNGFKIFYCNIAESVGLLDEIDPNIRLHSDPCR